MQRWVVILVLAMICAVPNYIGVQGFVVPQDRGQRVSGSTGARNTTRKLALVIGNSTYTEAPLKNPANDASDMAVALKQLGFEVMSAINANQREMKRLIREFGGQLRTGGVGVFFYAGHGMQVNGRNYLIPIGATINTEPDVEDEAVDVNLLLGQFEVAENGLNIVILDACRNNPFGRGFRSVGKGLAQMTAPTGTVVVYSTAPGKIASDGNTRNGLYTQELLTNLRQPGMRLEDILIQTRVAVKTKSGGQQVPWENGALEGVFYFVPPGANSGGGSSGSSVTAETVEEDAWNEIKDSTRAEDFKVFLREFPNGKRAPLARVKLAKLESPSVPVKPALKAGSQAQFGGMEFVYIPAGEFEMGSDAAMVTKAFTQLRSSQQKYGTEESIKKEWFDFEIPRHTIKIATGFYLGSYEVTQQEWEIIMGSNPSNFKGNPKLPVELVSWDEAQEFIKKLNIQEGKIVYRLPTEAEWEYACRAGTTGDYAGNLEEMGWYEGNSGGTPHPVGQKAPNGWGVYDMHGNVSEWCNDWFSKQYYQNSLHVDPQGPNEGNIRVYRGGRFDGFPAFCRSGFRYGTTPGSRLFYLGFRLVRMVDR